MIKHFLGTVEFDASRALPELAAELTSVCQATFVKDDAWRFDEVPAYVGNSGDIRLTLFGPAEEQEERECVLEVSLRTSLPITEATSDFFRPVFVDGQVDSTGHINCSARLASVLNAYGFGDCRPVR